MGVLVEECGMTVGETPEADDKEEIIEFFQFVLEESNGVKSRVALKRAIAQLKRVSAVKEVVRFCGEANISQVSR